MNSADPENTGKARHGLSPNNALVQSINDNSFDVVAGLGDITLDVVTSGILDGVPIIGTVLGLGRAGHDVRQWLFVKKVLNFLSGSSRASMEQRQAFVGELEKTGNLEKFGEAILLILDRSDDMDKPAIIGKLVAAHMKGDIQSLSRVLRIASIVDRSYTPDVMSLREFEPGRQPDQERLVALVSHGLVYRTLQILDGGDMESRLQGGMVDRDEYDLTESGKIIRTFGLA